jgi:hypothetical protein
VGGSQFGRLEKKPSTHSTLWFVPSEPFWFIGQVHIRTRTVTRKTFPDQISDTLLAFNIIFTSTHRAKCCLGRRVFFQLNIYSTVLYIRNEIFELKSVFQSVSSRSIPEAEFLDAIGTKVFRVFLSVIHSHLY